MATSMRRLVLGSALFLGLLCGLDAAIFRSGLYRACLTSESIQGMAHHVVDSLEARPTDAARDVLVLGDSRVTEGFNAGVATRRFGAEGVEFLQAGMPGTTLRDWCYVLERVDPTARRYRGVVLTLRSFRKSPPPDGGFEDRMLDADVLGPIVSLPAFVDLIGHQPGFEQKLELWSRVFLAARTYRADFGDLVLHPSARVENVRWQRAVGLHVADAYDGHPESMAGLAWDPVTQQLSFPPRLSEAQRSTIARELRAPDWAHVEEADAYGAYWMARIVRRYAAASARLVLVRLPATPLPAVIDEARLPLATFVDAAQTAAGVVIVPERSLLDLERPELFFDHRHLNAAGRALLTERLGRLLVDVTAPRAR